MNMPIDDKINLLGFLVPRFGSGDPAQEEALSAFASGLTPTFDYIRLKSPDLEEADVQILGTELLCAEILIPGRSSKHEFAAWLGEMSDADLKQILAKRKSIGEDTANELAEFRAAREEEEREREELRKKYEEQVKQARENRSMGFNPKTGKFEQIKKD